MRVLIVGGGIAGLTLAGLLQQRGFRPEVVEKTHDYGGVGYVLGLWPAGSSILKGLGLYEDYAEAGELFSTYSIADSHGETLHSYDMASLADEYGPAYLVMRAELVDRLRSRVDDDLVRMGTTVSALEQDAESVHVSFDDGSAGTYDLVVGADGIRSQIRELVFGDVPLDYHGFTGWAFWVDPELASPGDVVEYWTAGRFFGLYPTEDRLACFVAKSAEPNEPDPVETRIERIRDEFGDLGGVVPDVLADLTDPTDVWHDDFNDVRMDEWYDGRVVLIGDASHAVLPTAGVGASMAMESAAVLADELTRTDSRFVTNAFERFVDRRRERVDRIQTKSRRMGSIAMLDNGVLAALRNQSVKIYSQERLEAYWRDILSSDL